MARTASAATSLLIGILRGDGGMQSVIAQISQRENVVLEPVADAHFLARNMNPDLAEKLTSGKYPTVHVYCDRIQNTLREKFRTFSGTATLVADVRISDDHVDELDKKLQLYAEAVTNVLDNSRGTWEAGVFYPGGYEVQFGAVKPGGKQFLQTARIRFDVHISRD